MAIDQIERLEIQGFQSIGSMALELRPLNVLIGANGTGKSNFIEFFRMLGAAFAGSKGELQFYIGRKGKASSLLHYGPQVSQSISTKLIFFGDGWRGSLSFTLNWGAPDDLFITPQTLEVEQSARDPIARIWRIETAQAELRYASPGGPPPTHRFGAMLRNRLRRMVAYHFHDTSEDASIRLSQDRDRDQELMANGGNLAVVLQKMKEAKPNHYDRILSTVQMVAPFIRDFQLESEPLNPRFVLLRWRDRSGELFGPHQLSDGTLRAIAIITALLQPEETLPSIMLFDEPELGLHPAAIGLIADLLKAVSLKRQVIVATQAPRLLTALCPEDVVVVERRDNANGLGESVFNRLSKDELGSWLEEYDLGALYEMNVTGGGPQ